MALRVAAGCHRDGDSGEQNAHQGGEAEKLIGALESGAKLRPRIAHALDALGDPESRRQPGSEGVNLAWRAGEYQTVSHATAPLHQLGGGHVGDIHQQPRRDAEEIAASVRLVAQHLGDAQAPHAELEAVTDRDAEDGEQARVDPDVTRRRHVLCRLTGGEGCIADAQRAAQRIALVDRLDRRELEAIADYGHASKAQQARSRETSANRLVLDIGGDGLARDDQHVAREELVRAHLHGAFHAIGEQAHRGDAGDRDNQCREQHAQLSGAPLALEKAVGKASGVAQTLIGRRGHRHGCRCSSVLVRRVR